MNKQKQRNFFTMLTGKDCVDCIVRFKLFQADCAARNGGEVAFASRADWGNWCHLGIVMHGHFIDHKQGAMDESLEWATIHITKADYVRTARKSH
jgi:hypothetical protein